MTNQWEAQKRTCLLSYLLRGNQDQDIIQTYHKMKTLVPEREQYELSKSSESPRGCGLPKQQNLPLIKFILGVYFAKVNV